MNKITERYTYRFAVMLTLSMSACGDATAGATVGAKPVTPYEDAQAHSSSTSTIQAIEIGQSFRLKDINCTPTNKPPLKSLKSYHPLSITL